MVVAGFLALSLVAAGDQPTIPEELRGALLIDSVVARVDRETIARSQLEVETRLALAAHGDLSHAQGPLSDRQLQAALEYLIDELLVSHEAERLGVFEVSDEEQRLEVKRLMQRFSSPQAAQVFFDRFGLTQDIIEMSLGRELRADRFLRDRAKTQGATTPEEIQAASRLLVNQLRSRADIRTLVHFSDHLVPAAPADAGAALEPAARASP
jgi:hypothetical protein